MQFTDQFHDVFHELLAPVRQSLGDDVDVTQGLAHPRGQLQQAADTLEDLGDQESAAVARILAGLLEIADDLAPEGPGAAPDARTEIVSFTTRFLDAACDPNSDDRSELSGRLSGMLEEGQRPVGGSTPVDRRRFELDDRGRLNSGERVGRRVK